MKKIMFVIGCLSGGGAERVVTSVASALAEKGFIVSILTYYEAEGEYYYSPKINRINISNGGIVDFNKMSIFDKIKRIRKNIKNEKPDEIICFLPHPLVYTYFSCLFSKYKKRISYAVRANPKKENDLISKIQQKLCYKVKKIITQNKGQANCFSKRLQKKIVVIPNPMYDELFETQKEYSTTVKNIVSVGRLTDQKNYELSINAMKIICDKYSNINYYIYGNGPLENRINTLIKEKKLEKRVFIMGFERNRNKIYDDKDIFIMTSKFEGMPNALAEAMCKGIPSISTNCEFGPSDLILNANMGILLDDFKVETLVNALEKVVNNYDEYVIKAKNAREILKKKYSFDKIMKKWIYMLENN